MKQELDQWIPEARAADLVVKELSDEVLVYDRKRQKAHCLNKTAALVWKQCDGTTSVSQIAHNLEKELNAPVDEGLVWLAIDELGKGHLLNKRVMLSQTGLSRREVMRRIGIAAAVALPAVTSIMAPTAAQAANCKPTNASCTTSAECCSGVCNVNKCT